MPQLVGAAAGNIALSLTAGLSAAATAPVFAAATAVGAALGNIGVSLALSAAANALSGALQAKQGLSAAQSVSDGLRLPIRQAIPDQRLILGRATTSGAVFFQRSSPPYIWLGFLLASHECGAFEDLLLNGVKVTLDSQNLSNSSPYYDGTTNFIEVSYRDGAADQAIDPIIARDFPDMPTDFRQRGHATVVIKAHFGANDSEHANIYGSGGAFNPLFRFQGAKCYDPRLPGCVLDDPSTWVWTDNASLNLVRWLIHPWPGMRLVEPGQIDWDKVAAAADIDDVWKARGDGTTERNHTLNGVILSSEDPLAVTRSMLVGLDGLLILDGGKYHPVPGAPRDPIGTLHRGMLAGGFEYQADAPDRDLINTIKTEFVAPDRDYQVVVGPVRKRSDLITADGRELETTLSMRFVDGHQRAQRLADRALRRTRIGRSLSAVFTAEATDYKAGDILRVDFDGFDHVNGIYQVMSVEPDYAAGTVAMSLVGHDNTVFDWNAAADEAPFAIDADVLAA